MSMLNSCEAATTVPNQAEQGEQHAPSSVAAWGGQE